MLKPARMLAAAGIAPELQTASLPWAQGTLPGELQPHSQAGSDTGFDFSPVPRRPPTASGPFSAPAWHTRHAHDSAGSVEIPGIASESSAPRVRRKFDSVPPSGALAHQRSSLPISQPQEAHTGLPPGFDRDGLGGDLGLGEHGRAATERQASHSGAWLPQHNGTYVGAGSGWRSVSPNEHHPSSQAGGSPYDGWTVSFQCFPSFPDFLSVSQVNSCSSTQLFAFHASFPGGIRAIWLERLQRANSHKCS